MFSSTIVPSLVGTGGSSAAPLTWSIQSGHRPRAVRHMANFARDASLIKVYFVTSAKQFSIAPEANVPAPV
ncbi:hypothetical protein HerbRD11066_74730 [Herbidospora sp. RD11066]